MTLQELHDLITIETADIQRVLSELDQVLAEAASSTITPAIRNGGASLVSQCYSGVENILKRLTNYLKRTPPSGSDWHIGLITMYSSGKGPEGFIDPAMLERLALMRRFRHVVHHGYGFKLKWETVLIAMKETRQIMENFLAVTKAYIMSLKET